MAETHLENSAREGLLTVDISQKFCPCFNDLFNFFVAERIEDDLALPSLLDYACGAKIAKLVRAGGLIER